MGSGVSHSTSQRRPCSDSRVTVESCSQIGLATNVGKRVITQDCGIVRQIAEDCFLLAVFDGHGVLGEFAAATAASTVLSCFPDLIGSTNTTKTTGVAPSLRLGTQPPQRREEVVSIDSLFAFPQETCEQLFTLLHKNILELYSYAPPSFRVPRSDGRVGFVEYHVVREADRETLVPTRKKRPALTLEFGTTCTMAVVNKAQVLIAYVGDSPAFAGSSEYLHDFTCMTRSHNTNCKSELRRLETTFAGQYSIGTGGYVSSLDSTVETQIAMTRALGHKVVLSPHELRDGVQHLARCGVVPTPTVDIRQLTTPALVGLCSDGVTWDRTGVWEMYVVEATNSDPVTAWLERHHSLELNRYNETLTRVMAQLVATTKGGPSTCPADNATAIILRL